MGKKKQKQKKSNSKQDFFTKTKLPEQLLWLADSPLFIDSTQIEAFYDAVVRPYAKLGSITLGRESEIAGQLATELNLGAELDSGELLGLLSAWLPKMKITGDGTLSGQGNISRSKNKSAEWTPIDTPQRQLEQLVLHYSVFQSSRVFVGKHPAIASEEAKWKNEEWVKEIPRGLVLIDFEPGTKFIPTFAEFREEGPAPIYDQLMDSPPEYPNNATAEQKREYWKEFDDNFEVQKAIEAVEKAGKNRIEAIDYRIPISGEGHTLHLHVRPLGKYPTINFAYSLIRRGFEQGLRLVGTMKSEPDMNVLAIYER